VKFRIALDCDEILSDFVGKTIEFAADRGHLRSKDQIHDFNIFKSWGLPDLWKPFSEWIAQPGQVSTMNEIPGSQDLVAELRKLGEVVVVTSPYKGAPHWIPERIRWLERRFGFAPDQICPWARKHWIDAHVLIDDALHNVNDWATHRPASVPILADRPWNRIGPLAPAVVRCLNYDAVIDEVARLARAHQRKGI
jgi:5'(3')-deoxyribonucleotidase